MQGSGLAFPHATFAGVPFEHPPTTIAPPAKRRSRTLSRQPTAQHLTAVRPDRRNLTSEIQGSLDALRYRTPLRFGLLLSDVVLVQRLRLELGSADAVPGGARP